MNRAERWLATLFRGENVEHYGEVGVVPGVQPHWPSLRELFESGMSEVPPQSWPPHNPGWHEMRAFLLRAHAAYKVARRRGR